MSPGVTAGQPIATRGSPSGAGSNPAWDHETEAQQESPWWHTGGAAAKMWLDLRLLYRKNADKYVKVYY